MQFHQLEIASLPQSQIKGKAGRYASLLYANGAPLMRLLND